MPESSPSTSLHSRSLYLVHLAKRVEAMERPGAPQAVAYRLYSRRLQSALAGFPESMAAQLGGGLPCVLHALAQRHFDMHGAFSGDAANRARLHAWGLFRKLGCRPRH